MNNTDIKTTIKIDPSTGELKIDLYEWFTTLTAERREALFPHWRDIAYEQIDDMVRNDFAAPGYDECIHKLRVAFLTSDEAPEMFRMVVKNLLREVRKANIEEKRMDEAYWELYRSWQKSYEGTRPRIPEYVLPKDATDADVETYIETHQQEASDATR
jgi:hypothetical protein